MKGKENILKDSDLELFQKIQNRMASRVGEQREYAGRELTYNEIEYKCAIVCIEILNSLDTYAINQIIERTRNDMGMPWINNRERLNYYEKFHNNLMALLPSRFTTSDLKGDE
ncbi:hypothetical protein LCGC14_2167620 [marine sediment metagenome]|uniref:Uncharacterized protein n=1 Tax=marine sediment metagenome TaxID=412755 RepID=A0A0F9GLY8_9ZZZZ